MLRTKARPDTDIHPTALIDPEARLAPGVKVGAYAIVGPRVTIGEGTSVGPHVLVERDTQIGNDCTLAKGAVLGTDPQDLKYQGERTSLVVGDRTVVREYATLNRGTAARGRTEVGNDCLLMAYVHVAHDCVVGDHVVLSNAVNMAGHVSIGDHAIVGGLTAIHQFVRVGCHAFVGGASRVPKDVPPYLKAAGNPMQLYGLNGVGLQRRGFSEDVRVQLKRAYRIFFHSQLNVSQAIERVRDELPASPELETFLSFVEESERGILV